jgi:alkylated DNA nucleotide flippase Atl1
MLPKNIDFNSQLVYHLVSLIPKGKVLTYGRVAEILSFKSKRLVGKILHQNKNPKKFRVTGWFLLMARFQNLMLLVD